MSEDTGAMAAMITADSFPHSRQRAFHWLVIAGVWVLFPLLSEHDWVLFIPFVLMAAWHGLILHKGWRAPGRILRIVLTLAISFGIVWQHGSVLGQDTGVALLIAIYGLKFSELSKERDYYIQIFNLLLLLLGNLLYDQSLWMLVHQGVAITMLLFIFTLVQQTRGMADKQRLRYALTMMLVALPLTIIMYVLFPRLPAALWGLTTGSNTGLSGFDDDIRPGSLAGLSRSTKPVFRASFRNGPRPRQSQLYWRGGVLSGTDGRRWYREKYLYQGDPRPVEGPLELQYEIIIEPHDKYWVFALDRPTRGNTDVRINRAHIAYSRSPVIERRTYLLSSIPEYRLPAPDLAEQKMNLRLPDNVTSRVRSLATQWAAGGASSEEIANKALRWFNTEPFYYTLKPPLLGGNPVDEFLFETRRGYCEHYASAFVTLLRAAGVPARVVIGFQGGNYNGAGDYYLVRQSDAHAWAEYLHPERGWTRADPTFAVAPARIEYGSDTWLEAELQGLDLARQRSIDLPALLQADWIRQTGQFLQQRWDALNMIWYRWVTDFGPEQQQALLEKLSLANLGLLLRLLIMCTGLLLVMTLLWSWLNRQHRRQDPVEKAYSGLCRRLSRKGVSRLPYEGPMQYLQRVLAQYPRWTPALVPVFESYAATRYGTATDKKSVARLNRLIRNLRLSD